MRTEEQMMKMILDTAREDDRILAVYMNGSRTNPRAPKDIFQDYDIVYVVTETESFQRDRSWIDRFGKRLFMQYPDEGFFGGDNREACYGWLIQFADGNRLDLHVDTLEYALQDIRSDRLCRILLDKQGVLPEIPEATDEDHWVRKPGQEEFEAVCNEFWWCLDNVAKGLWRGEIPYVQDMLNFHVRPQLVRQLSWKAGASEGFCISVGKSGKYLYRWLEPEEWERFLSTYAGGDLLELWEAVETMCTLFDETARKNAETLGLRYHLEEAENCQSYLRHVRNLPRDAAEIYE